MHTARQLKSTYFSVRHWGRPATRTDLLPDWNPLDRLGIVVTTPFGGVGASHLIQLAITAFYDVRPSRRDSLTGKDEKAIYPEIYLFHVGGRHGDYSSFDFWPARKEVFVASEPRLVLDAINDRAITRLAVPDKKPRDVVHEFKEPAAARDRIATAFVYSPDGRVSEPEWEIAGLHRHTEDNPAGVLNPESRRDFVASSGGPVLLDDELLTERSWDTRTLARLDEAADSLDRSRRQRSAVRGKDGLATETYRGIDVDTALRLLV